MTDSLYSHIKLYINSHVGKDIYRRDLTAIANGLDRANSTVDSIRIKFCHLKYLQMDKYTPGKYNVLKPIPEKFTSTMLTKQAAVESTNRSKIYTIATWEYKKDWSQYLSVYDTTFYKKYTEDSTIMAIDYLNKHKNVTIQEDIFLAWLESGMTPDEFSEKKRGFVAGAKFGF